MILGDAKRGDVVEIQDYDGQKVWAFVVLVQDESLGPEHDQFDVLLGWLEVMRPLKHTMLLEDFRNPKIQSELRRVGMRRGLWFTKQEKCELIRRIEG